MVLGVTTIYSAYLAQISENRYSVSEKLKMDANKIEGVKYFKYFNDLENKINNDKVESIKLRTKETTILNK